MGRSPKEAFDRATRRSKGQPAVDLSGQTIDEEQPSASTAYATYAKAAPLPAPSKVGRPPIPFDRKIADYVLNELAAGQRSLRSILDDRDEFPSRNIIFRWLVENPEFHDQYAKAREIQQHSYADDIIWIADNEPDPQVARVKIDARKWTASKLLPSVYGDRLDANINVSQSVNTDMLKRLTPEEREQLRVILSAAMQREQANDDAEPALIEGVVSKRR